MFDPWPPATSSRSRERPTIRARNGWLIVTDCSRSSRAERCCWTITPAFSSSDSAVIRYCGARPGEEQPAHREPGEQQQAAENHQRTADQGEVVDPLLGEFGGPVVVARGVGRLAEHHGRADHHQLPRPQQRRRPVHALPRAVRPRQRPPGRPTAPSARAAGSGSSPATARPSAPGRARSAGRAAAPPRPGAGRGAWRRRPSRRCAGSASRSSTGAAAGRPRTSTNCMRP